MIRIDKEKCIGCGQCVRDCFPGEIKIENNKAVPKDHNCMECGHCIAVCPMNAITLENCRMEDVIELDVIDTQIDPEVYLNHLKSRRSIRQFKNVPVSENELKMILSAGRYSPTGGNLQNVSYYVSRKDIDTLRNMIITQLKKMGDEAQITGNKVSWYSDLWVEMYEDFVKNGADRLFFDAGTVIVVSSDSAQAACIAAAHMETMVYSLGLGMLYSGFSTRAIASSEELKQYLHLKEGYSVYAVLVIGHTAVKYKRTVPRKPVNVIFN